MKKFAIISMFICFLFILSGCNKKTINENKSSEFLNNTFENKENKTITENITNEEIIETSNNTIIPDTSKTNKEPETKVTVKKDSEYQESKTIENNISINVETTPQSPKQETLEPTPEVPVEAPKGETQEEQKELKNGYFYNAEESSFLVSEFKRITNNSSSFSVRIDSSAKGSNPFWPYKESEIQKQVSNVSFGYFMVYAEDYYKDDIKQRTIYYICFDV